MNRPTGFLMFLTNDFLPFSLMDKNWEASRTIDVSNKIKKNVTKAAATLFFLNETLMWKNLMMYQLELLLLLFQHGNGIRFLQIITSFIDIPYIYRGLKLLFLLLLFLLFWFLSFEYHQFRVIHFDFIWSLKNRFKFCQEIFCSFLMTLQ